MPGKKGRAPSYADLDEVLERLLDAPNKSFSWVGGNRLWPIAVLRSAPNPRHQPISPTCP